MTEVLKDHASRITVGYVGTMAREYRESGVTFLRSLNVKPYRLELEDVIFINSEFHSANPKSALYPGDVVIVRTGRPGTAAVIPEWLGEANCSDLVIVRPGKSLDSHFLAYFLNSEAGQNLIRSRHTGSVQIHFNTKAAQDLPVSFPPLAEQKRISAVLGALDDKIENNRKMNETLEAMAQAIFKSWFVDFDPAIDNALRAGNLIPEDLEQRADGRRQAMARDSHKEPPYAHLFPDQFVYSELGSVPAGWGWVPFAQAGKWMSGGTPSKNRAEYWDGEIPWFSAKSLGPVWLRDSADRVTALGADSGTSKVPRRSVIFLVRGMSLAKELRIGITSRESTLNQDLKAIIDDGTVVPELLLLWLLVHRETIRSHADEAGHGTKRLPTDVLHTFHLALPPRFEQDRLAEHLAPFVEKIESNQAESETLTSLRDILLPKLISGELRVPEIEGLVEDVL